MSVGSAAAATPGDFTVSPNPVVAGNTVTFSGTGCARDAGDPPDFALKVIVSVLDDSSSTTSKAMALMGAQAKPFDDSTVVTATPKPDGTWSAELPVPIEAVGDVPFGAVCDHYNTPASYAPVTLTIAPSPNSPVTVFLPDFSDASVPALSTGVSYEVAALGFAAGEKVEVIVHSAPVVLTTLASDEFGFVDGSFTLPSDTAAGSHTLTLAGLTSKKEGSLPITVKANAVTTVTATVTASASGSTTTTAPTTPVTTAAVVVTVTTSGPTLAATGTPAAAMSWIGAALTLLGAMTLILARRRSQHVH